MERTIATEDLFGYSCRGPATVPTVQRLAELDPSTIALMHGPAHAGRCGAWLGELAQSYAERIAAASPAKAAS